MSKMQPYKLLLILNFAPLLYSEISCQRLNIKCKNIQQGNLFMWEAHTLPETSCQEEWSLENDTVVGYWPNDNDNQTNNMNNGCFVSTICFKILKFRRSCPELENGDKYIVFNSTEMPEDLRNPRNHFCTVAAFISFIIIPLFILFIVMCEKGSFFNETNMKRAIKK